MQGLEHIPYIAVVEILAIQRILEELMTFASRIILVRGDEVKGQAKTWEFEPVGRRRHIRATDKTEMMEEEPLPRSHHRLLI